MFDVKRAGFKSFKLHKCKLWSRSDAIDTDVVGFEFKVEPARGLWRIPFRRPLARPPISARDCDAMTQPAHESLAPVDLVDLARWPSRANASRLSSADEWHSLCSPIEPRDCESGREFTKRSSGRQLTMVASDVIHDSSQAHDGARRQRAATG